MRPGRTRCPSPGKAANRRLTSKGDPLLRGIRARTPTFVRYLRVTSIRYAFRLCAAESSRPKTGHRQKKWRLSMKHLQSSISPIRIHSDNKLDLAEKTIT